jgi:hypothetical protein
MLTLTAPGDDTLPRASFHQPFGNGWQWNRAMMARWRDLRAAAVKYANRKVPGQPSGVLVYVPERQKRGALHLHVVLGAETQLQRRWCEAFGRYCVRNKRRYGFGRESALDRQWTRAAEGLGRYVGKLGRYITKGRLSEAWETGELPARAFYVSRRLLDCSGVTIRLLRRRVSLWGNHRLSLPDSCLLDWVQLERELRRELNFAELRDLPAFAQGP